MRVSVGKSPKSEGSSNGQLKESTKAKERTLGTALSIQCSPNWPRMVNSVHQGDATVI